MPAPSEATSEVDSAAIEVAPAGDTDAFVRPPPLHFGAHPAAEAAAAAPTAPAAGLKAQPAPSPTAAAKSKLKLRQFPTAPAATGAAVALSPATANVKDAGVAQPHAFPSGAKGFDVLITPEELRALNAQRKLRKFVTGVAGK